MAKTKDTSAEQNDNDTIENFKQDKMYCYAWDIINGKGGGEYIYSLQEDYIYVYEEGFWKKLFDIEFLDRVEQQMKEITKYPLAVKKQIIENFKFKKYLRLEKFNQMPLINFTNYMFDPVGMNVLAHKKEYFSTIRVPYEYNALAKCELWIKSLNEILENDQQKINLLQEFFGYCLIPEIDQKKALLLLGDTDTGKSTILFILKDLLGEINCSNVPLQYLPNPQYTPLLINKMVNIDADVNKNAGDYEREFKIITSGESVSCNQKHIPTFEFIPKCKIILAANIFPKITDHSSAFYQRLILIPCDRRFSEEEKNRNLHKELKEELPGIFNWVVEGLQRLKKRGRFEQFDFMKDAVQELEDENNPINSFFDEHIEIEILENTYIEKAELFQKYKNWCEKNKQYNLSHIRFSNCLHKKYRKETPKDARLSNNGSRIWRNIKYVELKSGIVKQEVNWQDTESPRKTLSSTTIKAEGIIDWGEA